VKETEIREAVRIGRMVRKGAMANFDGEAKDLLGQKNLVA
jgi:hypothetical protein